jgi:hypothetical protein
MPHDQLFLLRADFADPALGPGAAPLDLDSIEPSTIAAAEYYTPATLPAQFNIGGNSPCGTLLLWSRW